MTLSLALGIKHSFDVDHLVAVSGYLSRSNSLKHSLKLGIHWAVGHMLTATIITIFLYTIKETFAKQYLANFEYLVGIMLIILGTYSLLDLLQDDKIVKSHGKRHSHKECDVKHHHKHVFGIGVIHGLASNDELLLLFAVSLGITSLAGILTCVAIFSTGVIIGMCLFALTFTIPVLRYMAIRKLLLFVSGVSGLWCGLSILSK